MPKKKYLCVGCDKVKNDTPYEFCEDCEDKNYRIERNAESYYQQQGKV